MSSRAEQILAKSKDILSREEQLKRQQEQLETRKRAAEEDRRIVAEYAQRQFWTEKGVLPVLEELQQQLPGSYIGTGPDRIIFYLHRRSSVTIAVIGDTKQEWRGGGFKIVRNKDVGRLSVQGKVVGKDGAFDELLAYGLAHPIYDDTDYT